MAFGFKKLVLAESDSPGAKGVIKKANMGLEGSRAGIVVCSNGASILRMNNGIMDYTMLTYYKRSVRISVYSY